MIRVKRLTETAKLPTRATEFAAGADLYADTQEEIIIHPGERTAIHTGLAMQIPYGFAGYIFARSGLACKQGIRPSNCVGVIDADYRGEIIVALHNHSQETRIVENKDRIA